MGLDGIVNLSLTMNSRSFFRCSRRRDSSMDFAKIHKRKDEIKLFTRVLQQTVKSTVDGIFVIIIFFFSFDFFTACLKFHCPIFAFFHFYGNGH